MGAQVPPPRAHAGLKLASAASSTIVGSPIPERVPTEIFPSITYRAAALIRHPGHGGVGRRNRKLGERAEVHLEPVGPETRIAGR